MTADEVRAILRQKLGDGTQVDLAKSLGISPAYLSDILSGARDPGDRVLDALGLERAVDYRPLNKRRGKARAQ